MIKIECKCDKSTNKQSIFLEYTPLQKKNFAFSWYSFTVNRGGKTLTWINLHLEPQDYQINIIMKTLIYVIGMVLLFLRCRSHSHEKSQAGRSEERWLYLQATGAKKVIFKACHSGKLKLAYNSPNVISTSPKAFWWAELILKFFCYLNSSKNFTCLSGKLRTNYLAI